ncbi:MAG TPA: site-specific integrase [Terracidiphilus sp.]|nr:site-specific integrase [Terracidiphilus sp.]
MPRRLDSSHRGAQVNVLKKVRTSQGWRLCPVVRETNGRLRDRVRVGGRIEVHAEGVYYLEWREEGRRLRAAIPNAAEVLERARLKSLELDAKQTGIAFNALRPDVHTESLTPVPRAERCAGVTIEPATNSNAARFLLSGIEAYIKERVEAALRSRLATAGASEVEPETAPPLQPELLPPPPEGYASSHFQKLELSRPPESNGTADSREDAGTIAQSIDTYLKDVEPPQREPKTYEEYRNVLNRFRDTCKKEFVKDVDRKDCLEFMRHLYSIGNEARTVYNRIGIVQQWLRLNGITGLLHGRDKPNFVANMREMYQPEDLEALFKACNAEERIRYLFFLLTGERDKEVRYTAWSDIDFNRKCVRVTAKKQLGFKPKDKEEREIPVPAALLEALREYKNRQTGSNRLDLVFPTSEGKPDKKFENKLKRIACRSGLNCGRCTSKYGNQCSEGPYCGKWFLHKFRHTFATTCLEEGVSIRTLQEWLGHSDLASTMVYLKYVGRQGVHEIIDKSAMAEFAVTAFRSEQGAVSRSAD